MQTGRFTYSRSGEPHLRRRLEILSRHPEIRQLQGYDTRTVWITLAVVVAQLALAALVAREVHALQGGWSWALLGLAAYLPGAILNHWLAMTVHETSHNLALATPAQNKALALFANFPIVFPMAMTFHRYHIPHHTYLGVDTRDTDLPLPREVGFIGNSRVLKFAWLLFYMIVYAVRGLFFISAPDRLELLNIATQTVATAVIWIAMGPIAVLYLAFSTFFGMSLHPVAAHFIHEHYIFSPGQETYSYYGPLNRVTYNVGYHNEHHDFMNVPGRRLPELHRIAREYYEPLASHRSWTYVLWRFIMDPGISLANRIVRTESDFRRGAEEARSEWRARAAGA